MKTTILLLAGSLFVSNLRGTDDSIESIKRELDSLKKRVTALEDENTKLKREATFDRVIIKKELIVSDTSTPWEPGFEAQQIARGIYARSLFDGPGGLWVRSRLIKGEIDDPFDDRFHALERNGFRTMPGHISWNTWIDGAWRQTAIIQGEGMEMSEVPREQWSGGNHPGRLRFQTFRPNHSEPLTDVLIGQGMMSIGGGGFGGGGLPYPGQVLELWGGEVKAHPVPIPEAPTIMSSDSSGAHEYAVIAIAPNGQLSQPSRAVKTTGRARLRWDNLAGADSFYILCDGKKIGPLRIEGAQKEWTDK